MLWLIQAAGIFLDDFMRVLMFRIGTPSWTFRVLSQVVGTRSLEFDVHRLKRRDAPE
jgi:hypothetical protein